MDIFFGKKAKSCARIESEVGLAPGTIQEMKILGNGSVKLKVSSNLSAQKKKAIEVLLGLSEINESDFGEE